MLSALLHNEAKKWFWGLLRARPRRAAGMDSWGWAILLAAVTAVSAMLLMALYDEISRRKWLAKSGAERLSASHSSPHKKIRLSACVPCPPGS